MKQKLITAKSAGFCFGVRRAINLAESIAKKNKKIYTFGPLIHNPQEVERLAGKGIKPVNAPLHLKDCTLVLRTHGIPHELFEKLKKKDIHLVDATCPFVKRGQDIVKKISSSDMHVIVVGEKTHPEVVALVSYGRGRCRILEKKSDLNKVKLCKNVSVVSQTTQTPENFKDIIKALKKKCAQVKIYNTICKATIDRQAEAKRLAQKVDVIVVVGGKNSGNTRRLAEISSKYTETYLIEKADEIRHEWFKNQKLIGLTAGASTPDWIIENVKNKIMEMSGIGEE